MSATAKIALRGVTKSFGPKKVLQGIDLDVAPGESMVVIGGSGSGKSVLLKCILGLMAPDRGSITVDGEETVGFNDGPGFRPVQSFMRRSCRVQWAFTPPPAPQRRTAPRTSPRRRGWGCRRRRRGAPA